MITDNQIIRLIFGFKMRYLRQQKDYSYQELADKTGLSTSYLSDIEKGKRYPKPDKVSALAEALGVDYNYMVATNASKKLQPIIDLLNSKFLKLFPLDEFGISVEKLVELFTQTPDRVNAFISTIFKIARNYQVDEKEFYLEALRSYQDICNNYFPELEQAVNDFRTTHKFKKQVNISPADLEKNLQKIYDIKVDRTKLANNPTLRRLRSFYDKDNQVLFIQKNLSEAQENFLLARELGFQYLQLALRPYETRIIEIDSFEKLLNNYKASHFASALLMDENLLAADIRALANEKTWQPKLFLQLLDKYNVSTETLMHRMTNILPHHFGIEDLFFIRMSGNKELSAFKMNKNLHLAQLHSPYRNELNEHFCNRWVSVTSIKELRFRKGKKKLIADAQVSQYWKSDKSYLCLSIAKPSFDKENGVSVTIGLLVNPHLKSIFYFLSDPKLKYREVHTTCERCGIIDCEARAASPVIIEQQEEQEAILKGLKELK